MTKLTLTLSVLTVSLLALLVVPTRTAHATPTPNPEAWSADILGIHMCVGDVDRPQLCDMHIPSAASAARAHAGLPGDRTLGAAMQALSLGLLDGATATATSESKCPPAVCEPLGVAAQRGIEAALDRGHHS
jgi:hypothetical protein